MRRTWTRMQETLFSCFSEMRKYNFTYKNSRLASLLAPHYQWLYFMGFRLMWRALALWYVYLSHLMKPLFGIYCGCFSVLGQEPTYWRHCQDENIQDGQGSFFLRQLPGCRSSRTSGYPLNRLSPCTMYPVYADSRCLWAHYCSKGLILNLCFTHFIYMLCFSFYDQIDN